MAQQSSKKKDRKAKADRRRAKKAQEDRKECERLKNSIGPKLESSASMTDIAATSNRNIAATERREPMRALKT